MAYYDAKKNIPVCYFCGPHRDIVKVKTTYAFTVLLKELMSMCIHPRILLEEKIERWS